MKGPGRLEPDERESESGREKEGNRNSVLSLRPQNLRPGIKVTLSTLLEGKNFNAGGHKVGVGLDFES